METIRSLVLSLLFLIAAPAALAADTAPDALLRTVTSEVMSSLKQDRDVVDDPSRLAGLIETKVLPVFDFPLMTQLAMGRYWRAADPAQQALLAEEFKTMLVRTYSSALASYRDHAIVYKPFRSVPGETDATVRSEMKHGHRLLRIDYDMSRTPDGWKVYDIKLDGISVVKAYREGFAARVRQAGVEGLIRELSEKNRQAGPPPTSLAGG